MRHVFVIALLMTGLILPPAAAQEEEKKTVAPKTAAPVETVAPKTPAPVLTLEAAVMCERIQNFEPVNPAVVFSISTERIICFNLFDPVPKQTYIYHKWYRRDTLSKRTRLTLKSPRWATFSSILLREGDKGPWRVEITNEKGKVLRILRFSITD